MQSREDEGSISEEKNRFSMQKIQEMQGKKIAKCHNR